MQKSKRTCVQKKIAYYNPSKCSCGNGEYLVNAIEDSVLMFDEIVNSVYSL